MKYRITLTALCLLSAIGLAACKSSSSGEAELSASSNVSGTVRLQTEITSGTDLPAYVSTEGTKAVTSTSEQQTASQEEASVSRWQTDQETANTVTSEAVTTTGETFTQAGMTTERIADIVLPEV